MADYLGNPKVQFFDSDTQRFLEGGALYAYVAGSMTPTDTYPTPADALAMTNANDWPVVLDARGEADVVLLGATKLILKDSVGGNTIWTVDGVNSSTSDIVDIYGNEVIALNGVFGSVNHVSVTNAATGNSPIISVEGTDTDVGLKITTQAAGKLYLDGGATGTVEVGTTSTGNINLNRAVTCALTLGVTGNTTLTGTLGVTGLTTLVNASLSGTLGVTGLSTLASLGVTNNATVGGTLGVTGKITPTGGIIGTTTNDSAAAGNIGEYSTASLASGSAITLTTNTPANVTSISLTAGDWDVSAVALFTLGASSTLRAAINTTSATLPTLHPLLATASSPNGVSVPPTRVSISGTTTVYLVVQSTFGSGTTTAYGYMSARRVR